MYVYIYIYIRYVLHVYYIQIQPIGSAIVPYFSSDCFSALYRVTIETALYSFSHSTSHHDRIIFCYPITVHYLFRVVLVVWWDSEGMLAICPDLSGPDFSFS